VEDRENLAKTHYLPSIISSTYFEWGMKKLYGKEGNTFSFPFEIKFEARS
jgi:hypothetical protein